MKSWMIPYSFREFLKEFIKVKNPKDEWNYEKQTCLRERYASNWEYMTSRWT